MYWYLSYQRYFSQHNNEKCKSSVLKFLWVLLRYVVKMLSLPTVYYLYWESAILEEWSFIQCASLIASQSLAILNNTHMSTHNTALYSISTIDWQLNTRTRDVDSWFEWEASTHHYTVEMIILKIHIYAMCVDLACARSAMFSSNRWKAFCKFYSVNII